MSTDSSHDTVLDMKAPILAIVLIFVAVSAANADFASGLRSYEAGSYHAAYKEWLPLAEGGDPAAQRNLGHLYRLGQGVAKDFVKESTAALIGPPVKYRLFGPLPPMPTILIILPLLRSNISSMASLVHLI